MVARASQRIVLIQKIMKEIQWYGWHRDVHDVRDKLFVPAVWRIEDLEQLPRKIDWRGEMPPCDNQGPAGTCGPNMMAGELRYLQKKQGKPIIMPSRLFTYWITEAREGTEGTDSGVQIRDLIKATNASGFCPEIDWAYDLAKIPIQPPAECFAEAMDSQLLDYQRVDSTNLSAIISALVFGPVCMGFLVPQSFESDAVTRTGIMGMPGKHEPIVGGHAVLLSGVDRDANTFLVRNSWGRDWGMDGYFSVPIPFFTDRKWANDFWLCRKVE
jgi:C1A family cysteine protease